MQITLNLETFRAEFDAVARHADNNKNRPILSNVLCQSDGETLQLRSCSEVHRLEATTSFTCATDFKGVFLLPARRTAAILQACQGETVTLNEDMGKIRLQCDRSRFTLLHADASQFVHTINVKAAAEYVLQASRFAPALAHCSAVTDVDNTRYATSAVAFEFSNPDMLVMAATDTRQLAVRQIHPHEYAKGDEDPVDGITMAKIDRYGCQAIAAMVGSMGDDATARVLLNSDKWRVIAGNRSVAGLCIDGRFPRFRDVIPDADRTTRIASMMPAELARGCRLSRVVSDKTQVGVHLVFAENVLTMSGKLDDVGSAEVRLQCETYAGTHNTQLDVNRLLLLCQHMPAGEIIEIRQHNRDSAVRIDGAAGALHVLMPLEFDE